MAWSTPFTAVSNAVYTAAQHNASVRDNLLETAPAKVTAANQLLVGTGANSIAARTPIAAAVATSQTTTLTGYADLATPGPSVSPVTGTAALVGIHSAITNSGAGVSLASFEISGATTLAAADNVSIGQDANGGTVTPNTRIGSFHLMTGLTPGTNTFKMKYRVGSGTGTYVDRKITVVPL